jgi:N-acylneuraminate cytidylyltransferase
MSIVAIITARGGSKRIPRKNVKNFMGKPMLAYAIDAAISSGLFDEVMVSTEDKEIAEVALQYGAKVPFMRSKKTANDFATTSDVLKEVVLEYSKRGKDFDYVCCIYPCVPFLTGNILKNAYKTFIESNADSLTPIVRFSYPIQRAFRVNKENCLEWREPENAPKRSQDLEPMYHDVGMFYFMKGDFYIHPSKKTTYIEMDESNIQDIDTIEDWKMAELKYRMLKNV